MNDDDDPKERIFNTIVDLTDKHNIIETASIWLVLGQIIAKHDRVWLAAFLAEHVKKEVFSKEPDERDPLVYALGLMYQDVKRELESREQEEDTSKEEELVINFAWSRETGES